MLNRQIRALTALLVGAALLLASCTEAQSVAAPMATPPATFSAAATPTSTPVFTALPAPPPAFEWIGILGGFLGTVALVISGANAVVTGWMNRRRLELKVLSAECYYQLWTKEEVENAYMPTPGSTSFCKPGSGRRFFSVLEFSVHNQFPYEISVGRFRIDGWMYDARYAAPMYSPKRQYQVFDLYTRERTSLNTFDKMPPYGARGIRVEVFEDTSGPGWESNHSRYTVDVPKHYAIEYRSDVAPLLRAKLRLHRVRVGEVLNSAFIHRWGNLIGEMTATSAGAPVPQGLTDPNLEYDWRHGRWPERGSLYERLTRRLRVSILAVRFRNWRTRNARQRA